MNPRPTRPPSRSERSDAAAAWLARRDRSLSPAEQAEFSHWAQDPRNAQALAEIEGPFAALDRASRLRPPDAFAVDPDLLGSSASSRRNFRRAGWVATGLAAAAAVVLALLPAEPRPSANDPAATRAQVVRHAPERLRLPDGSSVDVKSGSRVEVAFTRDERRVFLRAGDAHFDVAKDATRPFVVVVGRVAVRAIGTAFTVSASSAAVEVLVTEGRVRVDDPAGRSLIEKAEETATAAAGSPGPLGTDTLSAGEAVLIPVRTGAPVRSAAAPASPADLERAAAWRIVWLEFSEMPLAEVAREFNRHGGDAPRRLLKISDAPTGRVLVSGTFRADSAEAFVRLLKSSFGIEASDRPDGTVWLRKVE